MKKHFCIYFASLCLFASTAWSEGASDGTKDGDAPRVESMSNAKTEDAAALQIKDEKEEKAAAEIAKREKAKKKAAKRKSKYPVSGSVSTGYSANHANFVESGGDFGTQILNVNGGVNYQAHAMLNLSAGIGARKSLVNDYFSRGAATSTTENPWEISDISITASTLPFYTIPVGNIGVLASGGLSVPLSRVSRSAGVITSSNVSTILSASIAKAKLSFATTVIFNWVQSATIPVDCVRAPDVCRISGGDTGIANSRLLYNSGLTMSYPLFGKRGGVAARYSLAAGYGSVDYADDQYTAQYAQTGTQLNSLGQSFSLSTNYRVLKKTSVSLSMATMGAFYTNDNKAWRMPLFDTESDLHHRTRYALTVSQSF